MSSKKPLRAADSCTPQDFPSGGRGGAFSKGRADWSANFLAWLGRRSTGARMSLVVLASMLLWVVAILGLRAVID
jgi:hypothetical protein